MIRPYLEFKTHNRLKNYCKKNGLKLSWTLKKAVNEYLDRRKVVI